MQTEDGQIINKCLNGETAAFGLLVDKYKESIYALAYSKLRNFHDAEDITQEAFISAYKNLHNLKRYDSFLAWLYSITSNLCKAWIRAKSRRPDVEFVEDNNAESLEASSSIKSYREELLCKSIHEALESLPEIHRQVLSLFYLGGMSGEDIARFLGIPHNAVRQRLYRAKSELKEEMLAMMTTTFEHNKLRAGFTLRIVETVNRTRVYPTPQSNSLPWGLSLAMGIIFGILSIGSHINISGSLPEMVESLLSGREYAVTIGDFMPFKSFSHQINFGSGANGNGNGIVPALSQGQNLLAMAPAEGGKIPDKPSVQLGKGALYELAYSPDGKILAASTALGTRLYDADNFNEIGILQEDNSPSYSVAFSPDGKILAATLDKSKIGLWDMQTRKQVGSLQQAGNSIAFSPDSKILAVSSGVWNNVWQDNFIKLWDVQKQELIGTLKGHTDYIYGIAFSPDGKTLASGGYDKTIRLWDVKEQKEIGLLNEHKNTVSAIAISPDGRILASGDRDGKLLLWDIQEQKLMGSLEGHKSWMRSLAFSPDGKTLVSGCYNEQLCIWDVQTQKQIGLIQGGGFVVFNPNGKIIASADGQAIQFWDIQEQKQIGIIDGFTNSSDSLAFSPDGKILASAESGIVRLWDIQEQKSVGRLEGNNGWSVGLNSVAFSPDGKIIASINNDYNKSNYEIYLFDVQKQERIGILKGHSGAISSIAFTPDGKTLVSSGNQGDQTVRVWDVDKQKELAVLNNGSWVHTVVISPDGETIAAAVGGEKLIRLWNTKTQKEIGVLNDPVTYAFSVAFSPDGKTLASCNQLGIIRIWNYKERRLIDEFQGPKLQGTPNAVIINYSPDGKWLISLYGGQFWDIQTQKEITTQGQFSNTYAVAFSPYGKWMATSSADGIIKLWEVNIPVQGKAVNPMGKAIGTWGDVKKDRLFQNYPNPFNPETWIPFSLSKPEYVKFKIYNSAGQLVRTLDLGNRDSGDYVTRDKSAYWDGKNNKGELVGSDTYYTVMQAGDFVDTKKMVMVK